MSQYWDLAPILRYSGKNTALEDVLLTGASFGAEPWERGDPINYISGSMCQLIESMLLFSLPVRTPLIPVNIDSASGTVSLLYLG